MTQYQVLTAYTDSGLFSIVNTYLTHPRFGNIPEDCVLRLDSREDAARLAAEHCIPVLLVDNGAFSSGKLGGDVAIELERIAQHPYHVIIHTSLDRKSVIPELQHPNRVSLLRKPFTPKELTDAVLDALKSIETSAPLQRV